MSGHPGGHPGGGPGAGHPHDVFHRAYEGGAPWDIGRPQPAFVEVEEAGGIGHRVLEIGCGKGDLSIDLAQRGHEVVGIDVVTAAVAVALAKADQRGVDARFEIADVLGAQDPGFPDLGGPFDAVVDVGFFHSLSDADRPRLLAALGLLLKAGGSYRFLCFSDKVPGTWGPRRISADEIHEMFDVPGWRVVGVHAAVLETAIAERPEIPAWLATVERAG